MLVFDKISRRAYFYDGLGHISLAARGGRGGKLARKALSKTVYAAKPHAYPLIRRIGSLALQGCDGAQPARPARFKAV